MKKPIAVIMTAILGALGALLVAMGIIYALSIDEGRRNIVVLTLFCACVFLMVFGLICSRSAEEDYRTVFRVAVVLLGIGLALLGAFFSFMWFMVSSTTYAILLAIFLISYGLNMIRLGVDNYFLSQRVYRVYVFDFIRSLPYAYYRYRT